MLHSQTSTWIVEDMWKTGSVSDAEEQIGGIKFERRIECYCFCVTGETQTALYSSRLVEKFTFGKKVHTKIWSNLSSVEPLRFLKRKNSPISLFLKEGMLIQTSNPELFLLHTVVCQEHQAAPAGKHEVIDKTLHNKHFCSLDAFISIHLVHLLCLEICYIFFPPADCQDIK